MDWKHLAETVNRMAGFLLLQNLHFHRPWRSDADVEPPWMGSRRVSARSSRPISLAADGPAIACRIISVLISKPQKQSFTTKKVTSAYSWYEQSLA